jgi:hypothetical protein
LNRFGVPFRNAERFLRAFSYLLSRRAGWTPDSSRADWRASQRDYHFLFTLSDRVSCFGLDHHASSDDRMGENHLTGASAWRAFPELLPHEMTHS